MTTTSDFWLNLRESKLLDNQECVDLRKQFATLVAKNPELDQAKSIAAWLVKAGKLSNYQATVLLKGHKGPFNFGRYRVHNRVADGPLQGWFQARHIDTKHPVVLHFLAGDNFKDSAVWASVTARTKATAAIKDTNLWRIYDLVDQTSFRYLVLEDPGLDSNNLKSLADKLRSTSRLAPSMACFIAWKTAQALAHLHQCNTLFGSLIPDHIWLDAQNQVKVLLPTEQIIRPLQLPADEANPGLVTAADYMAPELLLPGAMPTPQSDIYSLGSILFQMLTGTVPFPGGSIQEKLARHAKDPIDDLSPFGVEDTVSQFLNYLMAKNSGTRFQSAQEVADKLALLVPESLKQQSSQPVHTNTLVDFEAALTTESAILTLGPLPPSQQTEPSSQNQAGDIRRNKAATSAPAVQPKSESNPGDKATSGNKTTRTSSRHRRRKRKSPWANPILWGGIGTGILGIIMVFAFLNNTTIENGGDGQANNGSNSNQQEEISQNNPGTSVTPENNDRTNGDDENGTETEDSNMETSTDLATDEEVLLIDDDGETLWASPTKGQPIDLAWTPPGAQLFISIKVANLLATEHGLSILQAFGPEISATLSAFESTTGIGFDKVDHLVLSWLEDEQGQGTTPSIVIHLTEALDRATRSGLLGDPDSEETEHGMIFQVGSFSALIPEEDGILVFGPSSALQATLEWGGKPPLLRRTMAQLLKQSDDQRHINILVAPSFLFTSLFRDGNTFYFGQPKKIRGPLQWLLGEGLEAMLISLHFDPVFYLEARMSAGLTLDKRELITRMRDRMNEIPDQIESYIVDINPSKHWRALAFRFPGMIRFLHSQTRIQVEGQTPVLNIAMPIEAAPNLLIAGELSLASEPGGTSVAENPTTTVPQTIDELLKSPLSVDIPQQDLNLAIADIVMDVRSSVRGLPFEFDIKIDGNDLMDEGITRNQAIRDFVMENKPIEEILTGIVMKANPVTTVQSPTEKDQKLVWLITDDPLKAGNKIILLTTRKAAESKQYTLPPVFVE